MMGTTIQLACMLGIYAVCFFCGLQICYKVNLLKIDSEIRSECSATLDPEQAGHFVSTSSGPITYYKVYQQTKKGVTSYI